MATTKPQPAGLGDAAGQLWDDIASKYDLRPDELRILEDACREVELIDRLEANLLDAPVIVKGHAGQPVASPLVSELRQHRMVLKSLLASLKLPDEGAAASASSAGTALNQARWGRKSA